MTIVLIRDGRDVVVSAMNFFGWNLNFATNTWKNNIRLAFRQESNNVKLVFYENLVGNTVDTIHEVEKFLRTKRSLSAEQIHTFSENLADADQVAEKNPFNPFSPHPLENGRKN